MDNEKTWSMCAGNRMEKDKIINANDVVVFAPYYNAQKYIGKMIDSVLKQSFTEFQLLLWNDGSTDNTNDIIAHYDDERIVVKENPANCGVAYTRNHCFMECSSKYIAFMDTDDVMPEYRLKKQFEFMEKHPEMDVSFGYYRLINSEGEFVSNDVGKNYSDYEVVGELLFENIIPMGSAMIRRQSFVEKGLKFDEELPSLSDYDFWMRSLVKGIKFAAIPEVLQYYRIVETGISRVNSVGDKLIKRNETFDRIRITFLNQYADKISSKKKREICEYLRNKNGLNLWNRLSLLHTIKIMLKSRLAIENSVFRDNLIRIDKELKADIKLILKGKYYV